MIFGLVKFDKSVFYLTLMSNESQNGVTLKVRRGGVRTGEKTVVIPNKFYYLLIDSQRGILLVGSLKIFPTVEV